MNKKNSFNSWSDFISFKGSHTDRINFLKDSIIQLGSPNNMRQLVWVAIVDPEFSSKCLNFSRKTPPNLPTTIKTENSISNIMSHPVPTILQDYFNTDYIVRILRLFSLKRPDIGISFGMHYIAAVLSSIFQVEVDTFIMFCYIYEVLFPAEFFYSKNRFIGLHQELRIFALMAEKMRPKLLNCLNAVYKENSVKKNDTSPFYTLMKNIALVWFKTLLASMLPYKTLLRFLDIFLVFGIEFLHRFCLAYLSMKERFLINTIKSETKGLNLGSSSDALIIAGNLTKLKLLQKSENIKIEVLIKKCLKKETYLALNRFDYLSSAVIIESKTTERLNRVKKAKSLLKTTPLDSKTAILILKSFGQEKITRQDFNNLSKDLANWSPVTSNCIFSLFDENGDEEVEKLTLSIGICLMVESSLDQRIELCFNVFDIDGSGYLSSQELLEMIIKIESTLDGRSSFYTRETESLMKILDENSDSKISLEEFTSTVKNNKIFTPIIQFLQLFTNESNENFEIFEQDFVEIHSPINVSDDVSGNSSLSEIEKNDKEGDVILEYIEEVKSDKQVFIETEEYKKENNEFAIEVLEREEQAEVENEGNEHIVEESTVLGKSDESNLEGKDFLVFKHPSTDKVTINDYQAIDMPETKKYTTNRNCSRLCNRQVCNIF